MERAFKAQNMARHEPECLIGCAAYDYPFCLLANAVSLPFANQQAKVNKMTSP